VNIVEVKNLTKKYKQFKAVDDISFNVSKGEIFALIGPNGAGKSTTLKLLASVLIPSDGEILINKLDMVSEGKQIRKLITYLPEEAGAYKNMSGNAYLTLMANLYSDSPSEIIEYVEYAKRICGLGERLKEKVSSYSKGMTRKLLLARAIMSRPLLAILDEPTSGLDIINAMQIRDIIKSLSREGMSVLLSSHNMLEIEYLSDRVGIMNGGKIIEIGTPVGLKRRYESSNLEEVFLKLTNINK
jgi:ABC-2 type transport system ATP-binding protein